MRKIKGILIIIVFIAMIIALVIMSREGLMPVAGNAPPQISAQSAILIEEKTGDVLFEKAPDRKAYPASTTKIMTALIAVETMEKLGSPIKQKIEVPPYAVGTEGSSLYLGKGERISMEDLLHGLMLCSGNDAAETVASVIGGSRENFIEEMNIRAEELGCRDTHFLNPHGLYDDDHYTTVRDMARIAREAMSHQAFRKIVGSENWQAHRASDKYNYFYNKNKTVHQFKGATGIKIGYTKASGRTLVASAKRDGKEVICVVMNAPDWFNDAYTLMEYGFDRLR